MNPVQENLLLSNRRQFFSRSMGSLSSGVGLAALGCLLSRETQASGTAPTGILGSPHYAPKAKRVIYLFMSGAPSQFETFDYKPRLQDMFNQELPASVRKGQRITTMTSGQSSLPIAPSKFKFSQYGKNGTYISELLPHVASIVDEIAILKTVHTEAINHDPAITFFQTGSQLPGRPSLGAWLSYGLGTLNSSLPSFVVLHASWSAKRDAQALYNRLWGSGWLPSEHQGVALRATGDPVLYLTNPKGMDDGRRRRMLDSLATLNQEHFKTLGDPETMARIAQYEMAYRMQHSVPDLMDFSDEPEHVQELYGPDVKKPGTFAANCLLARRLAERDVRFIQIFHRGWDQHGNLGGDLPLQCQDIDQPCAGLIKDLKQRGMLEDTLVVWGGEFGRTVYCQGTLTRENYGRDHHPRNFSMWMAGAV